MHIEFGENPRGVGIPEGRVQGDNGGKRGQFTSNLGLRRTIPVTAGGSQVSKRGSTARGNVSSAVTYHNSCPCTYWND